MESSFNYMSPDHLRRVIDAIPSLKIRKWYDEDVEYLFKNLYWLALRPMEAINLCKEDFNLIDRQVRLGHTKTEKQGIAFIPPLYYEDLRSYLEGKDDGRLLPGLSYGTFYFWLKRLGKLCDIEAWTMPQNESGEKTVGHIFRKSIGKDMLNGEHGKKFDIAVISRQLRHSKVSTTMNSYLKANLSTVQNAWE